MHEMNAAREAARQADGKFGTQARAEADVELIDTRGPERTPGSGRLITESDFDFQPAGFTDDDGTEVETFEARCSEELNAKIRVMLGVPEGTPVTVTKTVTDYDPEAQYAELDTEVEVRAGCMMRSYEDYDAGDKLAAAINAVGREDFATVT